MLDTDDTVTPGETPAESTGETASTSTSVTKRTRKAPARKTAKKAASAEPAGDAAPAEPAADPAEESEPKPAKKAAAKKTTAKKTTAKKTTTKKAAAKKTAAAPDDDPALPLETQTEAESVTDAAPAKKATKRPAAKRTTKKVAAAAPAEEPASATEEPTEKPTGGAPLPPSAAVTFQAPEPTKATRSRRRPAAAPDETASADAPADAEADAEADDAASKPTVRKTTRTRSGSRTTTAPVTTGAPAEDADSTEDAATSADQDTDQGEDGSDGDGQGQGGGRRRRRRGGRRRRKGSGEGSADQQDSDDDSDDDSDEGEEATGSGGNGRNEGQADDGDIPEGNDGEGSSSSSRRRRRRRRTGDGDGGGADGGNGNSGGGNGRGNGGGGRGSGGGGGDSERGGGRSRKARVPEDGITALAGSTRLEAKKQRRREGREAGRRRAPIVSEAEFLARREAVDRHMVIRQRDDLTQIAVLEDKVLVEHYVARESQTSLIGNVYLGRVQNVLPSMEAAFIDIGKGRNAVLYAGEVNWTTLGAKDGPRKIENVLKSGQPVLVQVTKDPVGHKGARLTSQISIPGRFLVYVPDGTTSGISRKLPDTERTRLKTLLKEIVPDSAGVIVRTAAEGASEDELTRDVERLTARWTDIESKVEKGNAPQLLYGEPDLTLKVVRDLFTEDFSELVVSGADAWEMVQDYVKHVAPDLEDRLTRYDGDGDGSDVFGDYRIDEQIAKGLDRKVYLPSGGSLVIDRTEAMTVVDVNTGKFTGSGGNLEETVTKNNLEAAEEMVRQLRLRDIGGIIVIDFIDMVLESNRDLVLRRMVECLGRDRTRHQVAEVTSLGLVQMTRKRIGTGLLEAFSESCDHCDGRGLVVHDFPVEHKNRRDDDEPRRGGKRSGRGGKGRDDSGREERSGGRDDQAAGRPVPSPKVVAAMARPENADKPPADAPVEAAAPAAQEFSETLTASPAETPVETPVEKAEPKAEKAEPKSVKPEPEVERTESGGVTKTVRTVRRTTVRTPAAAPVTPAPSAETAPPSTPAPSIVDTEQAAAPAEPAVVTTVRRRSARRPAGPPAGAVDGSGPTPDSATEPGPDGDAADETPHVPVKRKTTRKR
ncbi:MAG: Rne/Rng family ribonuclease [Nocardioides sp.]|nr:Rne/Rng family ribonuclease [Nocardioides sp.]